MEKPVDMERVMDSAIENFFEGYSHLLARQIQDEGFNPYKYTVPKDVISICDVAINCLINTFEQVVTELLTSFDDVKEFIHIYSYYSQPQKKKAIIFRHTCRYILSILPKLNLSSAPSSKSEEQNIFELCKLIALTQLLHTFIQAKSIQLIENTTCIVVEVGFSIKIEYSKDSIRILNSTLDDTAHLIHKNYASEDDFKRIMSTLEENSPVFKILMDYISDCINRQADIIDIIPIKLFIALALDLSYNLI